MNKTIEKQWVFAMQSKDLMTMEDREPTVNWSGVGPVDIDTARAFATRLVEVCDMVESGEWDK